MINIAKLVNDIVSEAEKLHLSHCDEGKFPVNYVCIFSQSDEEFTDLVGQADNLGKDVKDTKMGPVYFLKEPIAIADYRVKIVKIRKPDDNRTEMGDTDFTAPDYDNLKGNHLGQEGWNLIVRPEMEMLELKNPKYNVLAYYSNPTLAETLGIKL